jgi:LPXTG-motif cell wall-anchored protein
MGLNKLSAQAPHSEIRAGWALVACAGLFLGACSTTAPKAGVAGEDLPPTEQQETIVESVDAESLHQGSGLRAERSRARYRESRFPQVSSRPENKGGYWLNGYYFVRGESGYEEISQLIYGRTDRAALLSQWNGGRPVVAGSVVYYNSPFRPDDSSALKVLSDDFSLGGGTYTVQAGDTLSGIAQNKFGSLELWREIAAMNRGLLASPDLIEVGQVLRLQPSTLDTAPALNRFIALQQERVAKQSNAKAGQVANADQEKPPAAAADDYPSMDDLAKEAASQIQVPPKTGDPSQGKISGFSLKDPKIQKVALGVVGLLVLAAGAFFFLRRRRQARELADAEANVVVHMDTSEPERTGTHF